MTGPVPPERFEPCPSAVPVPLPPEKLPTAFRARDAAAGAGVALGVLLAATTVGGLVGRYVVGSGPRDQWAPLICGAIGFGAGAYVVLPTVLVVAWRRRASPGFRVGVAIVLGLTGMLAAKCYLGV